MPDPSTPASSGDPNLANEKGPPPTIASFSSHSHSQHRSTILLHQKSPLLLATPPQVTRVLAYSHAFLVPLNKIAGILSWTTGDPWESYLFVAAFWFTVLYGDAILRYAGPLILVVFLILGMYYRRYSPLSSTGWTGEKKGSRSRSTSDTSTQHRKSLDEILATLQAFTGRCNILLAPLLTMTDFLSTQQTATTATTRPALTTLFTRILFASPIWFALTLPPLRIITGKRIVFVVGTLILSWHSRPARISRAILWRSRTIRHIAGMITGLQFESSYGKMARSSAFPPSNYSALKQMKSRNQSIRFTFSIYENQRRWIGLGWTSNMVAYERAPWTDEHLNTVAATGNFKLPDIEGGHAKWQWAEGSQWKVEKSSSSQKTDTKGAKSETDEDAWVYYDNKWLHGTRGQDGWGKYTRRRKWVRDAELVDIGDKEETDEHKQAPIGNSREGVPPKRAEPLAAKSTTTESKDRNQPTDIKGNRKKAQSLTTSTLSPADTADDVSIASPTSSKSRNSWFGRPRGDTLEAPSLTSTGSEHRVKERLRRLSPVPKHRRGTSGGSEVFSTRSRGSSTTLAEGSVGGDGAGRVSVKSGGSGGRRDEDEMTPTERLKEREADWGLGDDASMGFG